MNSAAFTVLMSVYARDNPDLFDRAMQSVWDNTLQPEQFVLVLDGPISTDLEAVVNRHAERPGFTLVRLHQNMGLAQALNMGLQRVSCPYVLRADADDLNLPDRFAKQLPLLVAGHDLLGGAIQEVEADGRPIAVRSPPLSDSDIRRFARRRNPFNHMTVGFRLSLAQRCGGYPNLHLKEDYGLWALMLARHAKVANVPDVLVKATTGRKMYERRGGWRYVRSELDLQRHLMRCGLQSPLGAVLTGAMRSVVFLLPADLRGKIYEKLLRRPSQGDVR